MIDQHDGWLHDLFEVPLGSTLVAAAAAGATQLEVADAFDFDPDGGVLHLNGVLRAYTAADHDADTVTLADPLEVAVDVDDQAIAWDVENAAPYVDVVALVELVNGESDDDPVRCTVDQSLAVQLPMGQRDGRGETVLVDDVDGVWRLVGIVSKEPWIDGGWIDPDTLPPSGGPVSDGEPPAASPVPLLRPGIGSVFVTWEEVENADPVTYDVHASLTEGFTPDATNLVGSGIGTGPVVIRTLRDGTAVQPGVPVYVRIIARDVDDAAAAGAQASAAPAQITGPDIAVGSVTTDNLATNSVTAEKVAADIMVVNDFFARDGIHAGHEGSSQFSWTKETGLLQTDVNGRDRIRFPVEPGVPNVMDADLTTRGLTALGRTSFRGTDNEISANSILALANGTTPPSTSPSIAKGGPHVLQGPKPGTFPWTASPAGFWWDAGTSRWYGVNYTDDGTTAYMRLEWVATDGTTGVQNLDLGSAGAALRKGTVQGVVRIDGDWYVLLLLTTSGSSYTDAKVVRFNSAGVYVSSWDVPTNAADWPPRAIGSDGTSIYLAGNPAPSGMHTILRYATTGALQQSIATNLPAQSTGGGLLIGSFDYGASRIILSGTVMSAAGNVIADEAFEVPSGALIGWDGARFYRRSRVEPAPDGSGNVAYNVYRLSILRVKRTIDVAYTWYDNDPTGGHHETTVSPVVTIVQGARTYLRVSTPPPADNGSANAPDSARLYIGPAGGTLRLQGTPFVEVTPWMENIDPAVGTAAPTTTTFPTGSPARLVGSVTDDDGNLVDLGGNGVWRLGSSLLDLRSNGPGRIGDLSWDATGTISLVMDSGVPVDITSSLVAASGWSIQLGQALRFGPYVDLYIELTRTGPAIQVGSTGNIAAAEEPVLSGVPAEIRPVTNRHGTLKRVSVVSGNCEVLPDGQIRFTDGPPNANFATIGGYVIHLHYPLGL